MTLASDRHPTGGTEASPHIRFHLERLNKAAELEAPEGVMRFGGTLCRIIRRVLMADPILVSVYLEKLELADAYMQLLVRLKVTPSVAFLGTRKKPTDEQLVGLHLSLLMGYVESTPFFFVSMETIEDMANAYMDDRHRSPLHSLEVLADAP